MSEDRDPADSSSTARSGAGDRTEARPPGTPRWVLALGVIAVILIVVFVLAQLLLGVQHGPGMHGAAEPGEAKPVHALVAVGDTTHEQGADG
jgi:hypothetical protein